MKKSTKLYLQGLVEFIGIPFLCIGLTMLLAKLAKLNLSNDLMAALSIPAFVVAFLSIFKGFWTLGKAKSVYDVEKKDPEMVQLLIETDKRKKEIRYLIKKWCAMGIAKKIYRNDSFSIVNFNNCFFLLCPYCPIVRNKALGMAITTEHAHKLVDDKPFFSEFITNINYASPPLPIVDLDQLEELIKYCEEYKKEYPTSRIGVDVEKELKTNILYKRLGIVCACLPILSYSTLFINELAGFLMSVVSMAIGIKIIVRSHKEYIKTDWKAIVGIIISAIIILITLADTPRKIDEICTNRSYSSSDYLKPKDLENPSSATSGKNAYTQKPSIRSYITEIPYKKGSITNNVFHSNFINLYGRLPEGGYTWTDSQSLHDTLPSVDWECGIKRFSSVTGLFTLYVGNDAGYEECITALENINPGFTLSPVSSYGSIIFTDAGLNDPYLQDRRTYSKVVFRDDTGIIRAFTLNKVNDRLVCVFEQYAESDEERLSVFCEY